MHLIALISPEIDSHVFTYNISQSTAKYFNDSLNLFGKIKNQCILLIPNDLISQFLSSDLLKLFLTAVRSNSQSGIIISPYALKSDHCTEELASLFSIRAQRDIVYSHLTYCLRSHKIPMLTLTNDDTCLKEACTGCTSNELCRLPQIIPTLDIARHNSIANNLKDLAQINIQALKGYPQKQDSSFILYLTKLMAILYCPEITDYTCFDNLTIDKDFPGEALHSKVGIELVCFTIFRALTFTSSTDRTAQKHHYSIDWHPNDPSMVDGFSLYRIDVLEPEKSGRRGSGATRMLIAKKGEKTYLLSVTDKHDFVKKTIESKLDRCKK